MDQAGTLKPPPEGQDWLHLTAAQGRQLSRERRLGRARVWGVRPPGGWCAPGPCRPLGQEVGADAPPGPTFGATQPAVP